jgi:hypothetical protein
LYHNALKTNDFNAIKLFAQTTLEYATQHKIQEMSSFANLLLQKIDMFEIDAIGEMLKLYESKINEYKSLIKE